MLTMMGKSYYEMITSVQTTWKGKIQSPKFKKKRQAVLHVSTAYVFVLFFCACKISMENLY